MGKVSIDLNSGQAKVWYESGKSARPAMLWDAIKASGFTPIRIELGDQVYKGPG